MARIRGLGRLRRGAHRIVGAFQRRGVVLLYHRIAQPPTDAHRLCVTPGHFVQHLAHLKRHYRVIGLRELTRRLALGEIPEDAVVLTFDDGYVDNLHAARPLLERYQAPTTVFVTSGRVGQDQGFWWDELERVLLRSPSLPERLEVTLRGRTYHWDLGPAAHLEGSSPAWQRWSIHARIAPTPRHGAYRDLYRLFRSSDEGEREGQLAQLRQQARAGRGSEEDGRAMTAEEVCQLGASEILEIGAHTMTHPMLASLPRERQLRELHGSKQSLEQILGRPVISLSYPYGGDAEVGRVAPLLARQVGFEVACTTAHRVVTRRVDRYRLPRFTVRDWDGEEFARRLRGFFRA